MGVKEVIDNVRFILRNGDRRYIEVPHWKELYRPLLGPFNKFIQHCCRDIECTHDDVGRFCLRIAVVTPSHGFANGKHKNDTSPKEANTSATFSQASCVAVRPPQLQLLQNDVMDSKKKFDETMATFHAPSHKSSRHFCKGTEANLDMALLAGGLPLTRVQDSIDKGSGTSFNGNLEDDDVDFGDQPPVSHVKLVEQVLDQLKAEDKVVLTGGGVGENGPCSSEFFVPVPQKADLDGVMQSSKSSCVSNGGASTPSWVQEREFELHERG